LGISISAGELELIDAQRKKVNRVMTKSLLYFIAGPSTAARRRPAERISQERS
jgi:hypothetical protein